ncbi:MAG: hypothetical protein U9Q07_03225, partial [Planctomycetota bacterium]|nr:hypothetical protein [Planctomycetota bacterium]
VSYHTQYIALGGVFLVMAVWSFVTTNSISKARAEFADMSATHAQAERVSDRVVELENELRSLQKKFNSTEEIDSKIDIASVLAEMSFLIEEEIVLSKVEFAAEKFTDEQEDKTSASAGAVIRAVRVKSGDKQQLPLGNVRFKVTLAGVAANAGDVAVLICKLEDSPYFCQIVPSFTRSAEVQVDNARPDNVKTTSETRGGIPDVGAGIQVSEFEINCYLANYRKLLKGQS